MRRRIGELEQGLHEVYATVSNEMHPLLGDDRTMSPGPSNAPMFATPSSMHLDPSVPEDDVINSFGARRSLSLSVRRSLRTR